MITLIVVDSDSDVRVFDLAYPDRSIIAVRIFGPVPSIRADRIIILRATQTPAWREAVGGERYDRWERESLFHRLRVPGEGLILL